MSWVVERCPVCFNRHSETARFLTNEDVISRRVECPICGAFKIDEIARRTRLSPENIRTANQRAVMSHRLRSSKPGSQLPLVTADWVDSVVQSGRLPTVSQQVKNAIQYIGDEVSARGEEIDTADEGLFAIMGAANPQRAAQLLEELRSRGLLRVTVFDSIDPIQVSALDLTLEGWSRYEEYRLQGPVGKSAFLALQFDDPKLDSLIRNTIKPVLIDQLGFELEDMRDLARTGIIDNIMREKIRDAAFVVVDLTHNNSGAYWEAGYAEGLGKPVLYICEQKKFEEAKTHFDTNHLTTVLWNSDDPESFAASLVATLRRSLNLFEGSRNAR
jgi:nucleoside 2-deoxyribosyltransferase